MKILKINQTIGVLLIVAGFSWLYYTINSQAQNDTAGPVLIMSAGFIWYGIARFMIWYKKD